MKKIYRLLFATALTLAILLQFTSPVEARQCRHVNKHCPPSTATVALTATPFRGPVTPQTAVYTCLSMSCETPGK